MDLCRGFPWQKLGFKDTTETWLNLGSVDYTGVTDEELKSSIDQVYVLTAAKEKNEITLTFNKTYGLDNMYRHTEWFIPFIQSHPIMKLSTSNFKSNAIRKYIITKFNPIWPNLSQIVINVDTSELDHCLLLLKSFTHATLQHCTLMIESCKLFDTGTTIQHMKDLKDLLIQRGCNYYPTIHCVTVKVHLSCHDINDMNEKGSFNNLKWFQILLEITHTTRWVFEFDNMGTNEIPFAANALASHLQKVWKLCDMSAIAKPGGNVGVIYFKKDITDHILTSDWIWIRATPFWHKHSMKSKQK